jgi:peptidoglycan hydrolase CwlO-like protein
MTFEIFLQTVLVIVSVCGAIYGMMNFLLKDIYAQLKLIDNHINLVNGNINEIKEDHKKMDQRVLETNKRMDGVYNVLLKRTENLK